MANEALHDLAKARIDRRVESLQHLGRDVVLDGALSYHRVGAVAGLNAMLFEFVASKQTLSVGAGGDTSTLTKAIGIVGLFSWMAVLYWGRMLAFIGNAF